MTSLGFRRDNDHIAERAPVRVAHPLPTTTTSAVVGPKKTMLPELVMGVPRGLVPTLVYSTLAFLAPILFLYVTFDFTTTAARVTTVVLSALTGLVVVLANDCCCWYNMMLAFHTALEVKVVDTALTFAYATGTSDGDMALAIVGAVVVILHLVPFFLIDRLMFLSLLAYAGVVVNAAVLVYLDSDQLLLVGASSVALLAVTMIVAGVCEIKTSLLSLVRDSVVARKCLTCERFEL